MGDISDLMMAALDAFCSAGPTKEWAWCLIARGGGEGISVVKWC